ncbi:MAG: hypothetical protein K2P58_12680 [Hyphomonadaceae bacterium]|nr:hypothetical protein [Hyphomonadaceae bacterium]
MAEFSPVSAASFAFQRRGQMFVLTRAALSYLALRIVLGAAFLALTWSSWSPVIAWYAEALREISTGSEPSAPTLQVLAAIAPWVALSGVLGLVVLAAFEAACLRWMVRHDPGGALGMNFGADTWRVFAFYWIWFALGLAFVVAIAAFYVALRAISGLHGALQILTVVGALTPLALIGLLVWVGVRLAPAAALSVANKRLVFLQAWSVTRGKFWPLLGGFVIVLVAYIVAATIFDTILRIPFAAVLTPAWRELLLGGGSSAEFIETLWATFSQPMFMALGGVYLVVATALSCVFYVAWFGVNARVVVAEHEARAGADAASA